MKKLIFILFLAGCTSSTQPNSNNNQNSTTASHNLDGYWEVNGMQFWHWTQNGNSIQGIVNFDEFDSSTFTGQIKGDTLQGLIVSYTLQGHQFIPVGAKISGDSLLNGYWYSDSERFIANLIER